MSATTTQLLSRGEFC